MVVRLLVVVLDGVEVTIISAVGQGEVCAPPCVIEGQPAMPLLAHWHQVHGLHDDSISCPLPRWGGRMKAGESSV